MISGVEFIGDTRRTIGEAIDKPGAALLLDQFRLQHLSWPGFGFPGTSF